MAALAEPLSAAPAEELTHPDQIELRLPEGVDFDIDQFSDFCMMNRDHMIERRATGEILIMPPAVGHTAYREVKILRQLDEWAEKDGTGIVFVADARYRLPDGSVYGPDASWILRSRLKSIPDDRKEKILQLAPDFIVELCSPSDRRAATKRELEMWIENGVRLAWMIDPKKEQVHVYTPSGIETLQSPKTLSGEPVLPGFELDFERIWKPDW